MKGRKNASSGKTSTNSETPACSRTRPVGDTKTRSPKTAILTLACAQVALAAAARAGPTCKDFREATDPGGLIYELSQAPPYGVDALRLSLVMTFVGDNNARAEDFVPRWRRAST